MQYKARWQGKVARKRLDKWVQSHIECLSCFFVESHVIDMSTSEVPCQILALEKTLLLFMIFNNSALSVANVPHGPPHVRGRRWQSHTHPHESANIPLYNGLGFSCYSLGGLRSFLTSTSKKSATPSHKNMAFKTLHHFLTLPIALAEESRALELDREGS